MKRQTKPKDYRHAALMQTYIAKMERQRYRLHGVEVPYWTGRLRFADVVLCRTRSGRKEWIVAEIKTRLSNIGQAIRQVRAASHFFFKHHNGLLAEGDSAKFPLVVQASPANMAIYRRNARLFDGVEVVFVRTESRHSREDSARAVFECKSHRSQFAADFL